MEGGDVDKKKQRRYGGALRGPDFDRRGCARGALKNKGARAFREEGGDPVDHVGGDIFSEEERPELGSIDVVKTSLTVEKEGGDRPSRALEGADLVNQGRAGV